METEVGIYKLPEKKELLETVLNDEEFDIKKITPFGKDNESVLVITKLRAETLREEGARLRQVKEVTESIRKDQAYSELKNANQRCLYLLDRYHIPKSVALDVIDEVKVQEITEKVAFA
ncbi:MAG: hypothetical protein U9N61_00180 [Euryarchaeota archaeon]|nr:hypothetical protein [Euryarchaeota archaeon]